MQEATGSPRRAFKAAFTVVLGLTALVLFVLSCVPGSVVQRFFVAFLGYIASGPSRAGGVALYMCLYVVTIGLMLPGSPLNLAAGYLFDFWLGAVVSVCGITFAATVAFVLGRTLMRSWAQAKMASYPMFRAIDRAVGENGLALVFLLRLSPLMPFPVLCYVLGATRVPLPTYVAGTMSGLAPATIAYCYFGTMLKDLSAVWASPSSGNRWSRTLWIAVVGVSTVLLILFITYFTKRALDNAMRADQAERDREPDSSAAQHEKPPARLGRVEPVVVSSLRPTHSPQTV
jgi:uncharacterized membrane protein YdjX (TVP38/TMEM64 family)